MKDRWNREWLFEARDPCVLSHTMTRARAIAPLRGGGSMVVAAAVGLLVGLAMVSVLYSPGERVGRGASKVVELEGVGDAGGVGGQSGRGRRRGVPLTFWRRKIKGPGPSMDVGLYSAKRYGDPWARADGGSYKLWADASKEPTGSTPLQMTAEQQEAYDEEEPDEKNQKNGWEEYQFDKWVRKQGGEPNKFWKDAGYERCESAAADTTTTTTTTNTTIPSHASRRRRKCISGTF
jgi:hypothetical protein